jgi:predicted phage terminase large subunit-like protein
MGECAGIYYIIDVIRVRTNPGGLEKIIQQTAELDPYGTNIFMEMEPGSAGVSVIDHYARHILKGYAFRGIKPSGPKQTRAMPFSAAASNGNVRIVKGLWNNNYINELVMFPTKDVHDDQCDATSLCFAQIQRPQRVRAISLK